MGTKSWANVRALRAVLVLFETMSGLKVNFDKSMLVGVNIPDSWLGEAASALSCRVGNISFLYLGLSIGGDSRRLSFWEPVLDRLKIVYQDGKGGFMVSSIGNALWVRERSLVRIRDGVGELGGGWFGEHITKRVGDGCDTFFWTDPWVDEIPLVGGIWGGVGVASTVEGVGGGIVGGVSDLTTYSFIARSFFRQMAVPLKVSILVWRLLRDRLPTKANLVTRGILPLAAYQCVSGCGAAETAQHLFISCSTFGSLWPLVSSWIGSSLVTAQTLPDHYVQFTSSAGGSRARRSFMQLIWLACVWVV
ncbi:hypothetical protein TSUD_313480 [Trifolium subterraneum]|uniref:Reverse transcriptase zinc-binding domain-containing protein n=1 Tax=Trifolium subterraneum TaxID=3900 RepID=A0A2Z6N939_TRISU|nr:hypothetical protein TSUD_313480 [Trifolium subterraneum]